MTFFSYLKPVCCSMSSSNCCFLTCIQISQEADQVVWYSDLFQNFPQFLVIHTVKGFGIVNKTEIDVFLELSCFFDDPVDVGNLISGSSAFSKSSSGSLWFKYCWSLAWRILSITLLACEMGAIVQLFEQSLALPYWLCNYEWTKFTKTQFYNKWREKLFYHWVVIGITGHIATMHSMTENTKQLKK